VETRGGTCVFANSSMRPSISRNHAAASSSAARARATRRSTRGRVAPRGARTRRRRFSSLIRTRTPDPRRPSRRPWMVGGAEIAARRDGPLRGRAAGAEAPRRAQGPAHERWSASEAYARFRYEAQAARGAWTHPSIAQRSNDAGTHDDCGHRPDRVLHDGARRGRGLVTRFAAGKSLSCQERLALFLRVAQAVASRTSAASSPADLEALAHRCRAGREPEVLDFGARADHDADLKAGPRCRRAPGSCRHDRLHEPRAGDEATAPGFDFGADVFRAGSRPLRSCCRGDCRSSSGIGTLRRPFWKEICDDDPAPLGVVDPARSAADLGDVGAKALEKDRNDATPPSLNRPGRRARPAARADRGRPASTLHAVRKFARRNTALVAGGRLGIARDHLPRPRDLGQAVKATPRGTNSALVQERSEMGEYAREPRRGGRRRLRSGDATRAAPGTLLEASTARLRDWEWWGAIGPIDQRS
jgi:hypothetical protein